MPNADVLHLSATNFSDLELNLSRCRSVIDFENLLSLINPILRNQQLAAQERRALIKLRQQAYDKKRKQKLQTVPSDPDLTSQIRSDTTKIPKEKPMMNVTAIHKSPAATPTFIDGFCAALKKIDGEKFAKSMPTFFVSSSMLMVSVYFLWQQSLEVYRGSEFANPITAAAGGIAMIVGFAAHYASRRTALALMACMYAGSFEAYLMVSGTVHGEATKLASSVAPELALLQTKASAALQKYQRYQSRHGDQRHEMYQNNWYEKNHVAPALAQSEAAFLALEKKRNEISRQQQKQSGPQWIKILYRLGLVLLCMIFAHRFFRVVFGAEAG